MSTVPSEVSEQSFTGNGVWVNADLSFPIQRTSDLVVWLALSGGAEALQIEGVNYDVSGAPSAAPTVTFSVAPPALSTVRIERTVLIKQTTNLVTSGPFSPAVLTSLLDYRTYVEQQLARRIAALEALGSLVTITAFSAQVLTAALVTSAVDMETTFAGSAIQYAVAAGKVIGVSIVKVDLAAGASESKEAVSCTDWTFAAGTLTINWISGLSPGCSYIVTYLLLMT